TDELDDETVSRIYELIRARAGGQKSIRKVTKPRQKLEELFLGIVERAHAQRASTSGAMHGGVTAAFLRGEESKEGQELIESLVRDEPPGRSVESLMAEAAAPAPAPGAAEQKRVIESLMQEDRVEPSPALPKRAGGGPSAPRGAGATPTPA